MKRNSRIPVNSSRNSLPGNAHHTSVSTQKENRYKTATKKNQAESKIAKGNSKSIAEKKTSKRAKTASPRQKYGIGNTALANNNKIKIQKDVNGNNIQCASRIPRPTSRDPSPSQQQRLRRTSPIGGSKPEEVSQENPNLVEDDEEEFIRLEKLCAEGKDNVPIHGKMDSTNDSAYQSDIVEQIFEEIFEPYEETSRGQMLRGFQLGNNSDFVKEVCSEQRSGMPYYKISQLDGKHYSRNTSSSSNEGTSNNVNIQPCQQKENVSVSSGQSQEQHDNKFIGKTINTSVNESLLEVININDNTSSLTEKKSLHHSEIARQGTVTSKRLTETTLENNVADFWSQSHVHEFEIEDRKNPIPSKSDIALTSKVEGSSLGVTGEEGIVVSQGMDEYLEGKESKEQSVTKYSGLKVVEDNYDMIELVEENLLKSETQIENHLPPSEVDLSRGTVDYCISNELQFEKADQCIENEHQQNLGAPWGGFGGIYEREGFADFYEREGHCLTDIEEENTADLAPSSSIASQVGKDMDMEWEENTLPLGSKRNSIETMHFALVGDPSLEQVDHEKILVSTEVEYDSTGKQGGFSKPRYHTPDESSRATVTDKILSEKQRSTTLTSPKSEKTEIVQMLTKVNVEGKNLIDSQLMSNCHADLTKSPYENSPKNEKVEKKDDGNHYGNLQVVKGTDYSPLTLSYPQVVPAELQRTACSEKEITGLSPSNPNFKAIGISPLRLQDKDCNDLKLSAKQVLSFGELNPITIDCVKLCRSKGLDKERRNSGDSGHFECDTPRGETSFELKDVKEELEKMNVSIVSLQKELEDAKEKVVKLRGGLARMRENRLMLKKCIEGN